MTAALVMVACPAWAGTGDTAPDGTCDSDPTAGVDCTLREAIQEAMANNNDPTVDVINFAIPGAAHHLPWLGLPDRDHPVTIDGYTEALGETTPATRQHAGLWNQRGAQDRDKRGQRSSSA